ncbi:uncharacterized protein LOC112462764 [Temnothorax curvispinosus]|uniref:Uncharacterized protein LOC112462764 n=1 Tax=Temnothorax curvispinosus TaxID=300111 RepID=A0A6J1QPX2_9HYME|nr:uncharacterized protein LOC112462764 [Temnothorax curvispinosus]XP_024884514.1 uncharacterized protein LOC112462764 [Temnothorax curvispinosus]
MAHGRDRSLADSVKNMSPADIEDIQMKVYNCMLEEMPFLKALQEIVKYQGFDPKVMITLLLKSHERMNEHIRAHPEAIDVVSEEIKVNGKTESFEFNSNMSFTSDIEFICLTFLTRGETFKNISKKSITQCMKILKTKYNINTAKRRPGTSLDNKVVTIRRIAASFPIVTVGLFHKGYGKSIVDPTILFPNIDLPRAVYSPMIASAIPKSEDAPLAILLAIAVKTDDILHQTDARSNLQTQLRGLKVQIYHSNAETESVKIESCISWGLLVMAADGKHTYINAIVDSRQRAKEIIKELRPTDPALNNILSQI